MALCITYKIVTKRFDCGTENHCPSARGGQRHGEWPREKKSIHINVIPENAQNK